jgi:excinuclease ABC subunit C
VRNAALEDLEKAPGVGPSVARRIYGHFHPVEG